MTQETLSEPIGGYDPDKAPWAQNWGPSPADEHPAAGTSAAPGAWQDKAGNWFLTHSQSGKPISINSKGVGEDGWNYNRAPWEQAYEDARNPVLDVGAGVVRGLGEGTVGIPGAPGDVESLTNRARDWLHSKMDSALEAAGLIPKGTGQLYDKTMRGAPSTLPTTQGLLDTTGVGAMLPTPQTNYGKAAENVASFLPGAVIPGAVAGNAARAGADLARFGVVPGLLSEGAGAAADKVLPPQYGDAARAAGGLLGTVAGHRIVSPMLNPAPADTAAVRANAVSALRDEGVSPNMGQESGRKGAQFYVDELKPEAVQEQREQFTKAAMRRVGMPHDLATTGPNGSIPAMMDEAGRRYEDAIRGAGPMTVDQPLYRDLIDHLNEVRKPGLYDQPVINAVEGGARRVSELAQANGNAIPARDFQTLRSDLASQARETADPRLSRRIFDLVGSLDNAMERHLTNVGGDPQAFRAANDYYKRALVLRDAATRSGAGPAAGHISPTNLASAAEGVYGNASRAAGSNPFSELAKNGQIVLGDMPSSGTSERAGIRAALATLGAVGGGIIGHAAGHAIGWEPVESLLIGEAGGAGLGGLLGRPALRAATTNAPFQRWWGNQVARHASDQMSIPGLLTAGQAVRGDGQ